MLIYKYYTPESNSFVMTNKGVSVRFSQPSVLNDIFEANGSMNIQSQEALLNFSKSVFGAENHEELSKVFPLLPETFQAIIKDKIFSYHNKSNQLMNDTTVGVLSLTRNKNSRSMWSYYADSHRGFMLEFDIDLEKNYFPFNYSSGNVTYTTERPPSLHQYILKNGAPKSSKEVLDIMSKLWTTKDIDWEKEEEFRVIANIEEMDSDNLDSQGFPVFTANVPRDLVKGIYLGARSSEDLKRRMSFWIKKHSPETRLYKAEPCETSYKMDYNLISI